MGWSDPLMIILTPLRTVSESNMREHWAAKHRRAKRQRQLTYFMLGQKTSGQTLAWPLAVTITRIAPRALDTDNLAGACKAIQDGIADWIAGAYLQGQDRQDGLSWAYAQRQGKPHEYGVEITLTRSTP